MQDMASRVWLKFFLYGIIISAITIGGVVVLIDPYFHYHKPLKYLNMNLHNERYQNNGILRHFEYDSVIIGTSMTENFKTSEFDAIFGARSVKVPFAGGSYKEINDALKAAFTDSDNKIKYVLRGLDCNRFLDNKDVLIYDKSAYPNYLYNNIIFDDVRYIYNKEVLIKEVLPLIVDFIQNKHNKSISFDSYANWNSNYSFGKDSVLNRYSRLSKSARKPGLNEDEKKTVRENLAFNVTELASMYPETTFYYFFTPYSFLYWDILKQQGMLYKMLDAENLIIEELLKYPNIKLYSFSTRFSMTCNLDNYKDITHYGEWVNSKMLQWIKDERYLITKDNYKRYLKLEKDFYTNFDFDTYFEFENTRLSRNNN